MHVRTRLETIDPAKAAKYLEHSAANRPRNDAKARGLANAIKNGEWKVNGETIKFNDLEKMEDGQHRCMAVMYADTSIRTFVTRGLPSNDGVFETIDQGWPRKVGHIFARRGIQSYATVAAAISWLYWWQNGAPGTSRKHPRTAEATALLEAHPTIVDSVTAGRNCLRVFSPSMATCLHYLFSRVSQDDADEFMCKLASGEDISKSNSRTSGIYWIRTRLLEERKGKARSSTEYVFPLIIKAWNAFRSKTVVKTLRYSSDEQFPAIQ